MPDGRVSVRVMSVCIAENLYIPIELRSKLHRNMSALIPLRKSENEILPLDC